MKPYLTIEWNDTQSDAKGWLVIYNFVRGYAGGGIRMHPSVTKEDVERLAETMAYKYQACESKNCGGCKGGIAYDAQADDAPLVLRRYILAMMPYISKGVSLGSDLGTNYNEILKIFSDFGCPMPMSKEMKKNPHMERNIQNYEDLCNALVHGVRLNDFIAGFGVACAADEAYKFLADKTNTKASIVVQGMGRVALAVAEQLHDLGHSIVGMADSQCFVTCEKGLDPRLIRKLKKEDKRLTPERLPETYQLRSQQSWVDYPCDILIPAALSNAIHAENAEKVKAKLIVEGANIPISEEADKILEKNGRYLICDFTANLLEAWMYDVVLFERVKPDLQSILRNGEELCRKNAKKQMLAAIEEKLYARKSCKMLFEPKITEDIAY